MFATNIYLAWLLWTLAPYFNWIRGSSTWPNNCYQFNG